MHEELINEVKRLRAQNSVLRAESNRLHDELADRDEARAQAARLAEALTAEIHCQTCDSTGIMGGTCDACSEMGYASKDCGFCHGTNKWEAECAECDGTKVSARSDLSIKALSSTDFLAWLNERIAEELERLLIEHTKPPDYWGARGPIIGASSIKDRIAELRQKENRWQH